MKMLFISTVLVVVFTSMPVAKARLGETLEECEKRYAHLEAVKMDPESYMGPHVIVKKWKSGNEDDIVMTCYFSNSRVASLHSLSDGSTRAMGWGDDTASAKEEQCSEETLTNADGTYTKIWRCFVPKTDDPKTFRCQWIIYQTSSLDIGRFPITTAKAHVLIKKNFDNNLSAAFPEPEITQEPGICAEQELWSFRLQAPNKNGYDDEFNISYERLGRMDTEGNVEAYLATTNGNAIRVTKSLLSIGSHCNFDLLNHLEEEEARREANREESTASKELDGF